MINKVILIGNVGNEPDTRYLASGVAVTNISLATSESWKDKNTGEKCETTEWHRLFAFDKRAEFIDKYVKKGDKLYVEGSIKTEKWQDQEGNDRYTTKIKVSDVKFVGGGNKDQSSEQQDLTQDKQYTATQNKTPQKPNVINNDVVDDDIPF